MDGEGVSALVEDADLSYDGAVEDTTVALATVETNETKDNTLGKNQVRNGKITYSSDVSGSEALHKAISNAQSGDTIYLGEGSYSAYDSTWGDNKTSKNLTFIGKNTLEEELTKWYIGAAVPTDDTSAITYNPDYSFDDRGNSTQNVVTFKNMTLYSVYGANDTFQGNGTDREPGFVGIGDLTFENCTIKGTLKYNGWKSTTFKNVVFNNRGQGSDYSVETKTGTKYTFEGCTFKTPNGRIINIYNYSGNGRNSENGTVTIYYKDCIVNSGKEEKCVLNINDSNNYEGDRYDIYISGVNVVNGVITNTKTCTKFFQVKNTYPVKEETTDGGKT